LKGFGSPPISFCGGGTDVPTKNGLGSGVGAGLSQEVASTFF
jgi:hypothetical protein